MFTVISNGWSKQFIWHSSFCAMHSNPKECDTLEKQNPGEYNERTGTRDCMSPEFLYPVWGKVR